MVCHPLESEVFFLFAPSLTINPKTIYFPIKSLGRRPNGFLGLSLNDRTILFLVILLDKIVSVG